MMMLLRLLIVLTTVVHASRVSVNNVIDLAAVGEDDSDQQVPQSMKAEDVGEVQGNDEDSVTEESSSLLEGSSFTEHLSHRHLPLRQAVHARCDGHRGAATA